MADLAETVGQRYAEMQRAPTRPAGGETAAFGAVDQERILRLIGLDPRDPKAHAVVMVARRYGLDPVLGHISIIPRSQMPYITRDGYLFIAHRSGQLDGIEVADGPTRTGNEWQARVAVYRKDMTHAFIYPGRAELGRDNGPEMAITRAERRALRRAFAVTLPREFGDDDGAIPYPDAPLLPPEQDSPAPGSTQRQTPERGAPVSSPETAAPDSPAPAEGDASGSPEPMHPWQRRAMFALFRQLGVADEQRDERLAITSGIIGRPLDSSARLSETEAGLVISELNRLLDERNDERKA